MIERFHVLSTPWKKGSKYGEKRVGKEVEKEKISLKNEILPRTKSSDIFVSKNK